MIKLPSIRDLALESRTTLLRLDLNVPLKDGVITSDARVRAAMPTINYALEQGARLALCSHLGRPKGERRDDLSLEPVAARLSELAGKEVILADDCIGDGVRGLLRDLRPGQMMLLENLRFHAEETKNDAAFSKALAAPFQVYVNDAFGASHRAHASIVGVAQQCAARGAGFLLAQEVEAIGRLLADPARPFVAVVGGAKVADKLGVLQALIGKVDALCIGGAMAYTFLRALGVAIGTSRCEEDKLRVAKETLQRARDRGVDVLLPVDHVAASEFGEEAAPVVVAKQPIDDGLMGLDIGPRTRELFAAKIAGGATIFWNGPMGVFEWARFAAGTGAVAQAVAESAAYSVVGGGDSVAAIEAAHVESRISHISTGGGASLELLQFGTLPGLLALQGKFDSIR